MTGKLEERSLNFDHIQEYSLTYFVITEGKKEYRLHLFCCDFENEEDLINKYSDVNELIALEFQTRLELPIEKWNIYIFYFVKDEVSSKNRRIVEQDKYSTRKFVVDNLGVNLKSIELKKEGIEEKLFFRSTNFIEETTMKRYEKAGPQINDELAFLLEQLDDKKKNRSLINEFLGVDEDE